jgi:predicted metal-binding membrane protein
VGAESSRPVSGPWTDLGTLAWFVGVWVVMMAAMMFPSVAPTVALYSAMTKRRSSAALGGATPLHVGLSRRMAGIGVLAYLAAVAGGRVSGDVLSWDRAGRWSRA